MEPPVTQPDASDRVAALERLHERTQGTLALLIVAARWEERFPNGWVRIAHLHEYVPKMPGATGSVSRAYGRARDDLLAMASWISVEEQPKVRVASYRLVRPYHRALDEWLNTAGLRTLSSELQQSFRSIILRPAPLHDIFPSVAAHLSQAASLSGQWETAGKLIVERLHALQPPALRIVDEPSGVRGVTVSVPLSGEFFPATGGALLAALVNSDPITEADITRSQDTLALASAVSLIRSGHLENITAARDAVHKLFHSSERGHGSLHDQLFRLRLLLLLVECTYSLDRIGTERPAATYYSADFWLQKARNACVPEGCTERGQIAYFDGVLLLEKARLMSPVDRRSALEEVEGHLRRALALFDIAGSRSGLLDVLAGLTEVGRVRHCLPGSTSTSRAVAATLALPRALIECGAAFGDTRHLCHAYCALVFAQCALAAALVRERKAVPTDPELAYLMSTIARLDIDVRVIPTGPARPSTWLESAEEYLAGARHWASAVEARLVLKADECISGLAGQFGTRRKPKGSAENSGEPLKTS